MKLPVVVALAFALFAVACAATDDPFEREAAAVVARADEAVDTTVESSTGAQTNDSGSVAAGAPTTPSGECVQEMVEDEYGLPVEIEICLSGEAGGSSTTEGNGRSALLDDPWFGTPASTDMATALTRGVITPCAGDLPAYPTAPATISQAFAGVFAAVAEVKAQCDDSEQFRIASHALFGQIEEASQALLGRGPRTAVVARSDEQLVAQAIEHVEWLNWLLDGASGIGTHRTTLWFDTAIRGHIMALPELGGVDTLVIGNSQTQLAVDPAAFPGSAYNASLPGSEPSGFAALNDYFGRNAAFNPGRVVVGTSAIDYVAATRSGCERDLGALLDDMFALHTMLYAEAPLELNEFTMQRLLARPTLRQSLERTPLASDFNRNYSPLGSTGRHTVLTPAKRAERFENHASVFEAWVECSARYRKLGQLLNTAQRRSDEVVVVLMPLDPELIARAPQQAASVAAVNNRIISQVEEAGGTVLDLTTLLSSAQMKDAVHVSEEGAALVTAAVAQALSAG